MACQVGCFCAHPLLQVNSTIVGVGSNLTPDIIFRSDWDQGKWIQISNIIQLHGPKYLSTDILTRKVSILKRG